jgi:hypothetical protein
LQHTAWKDDIPRRIAISRRLVAYIAALASVVLVVSCSGSSGQNDYPPRVANFGDSLSFEAARYYQPLMQATGETALSYDSHGGTAICDWLTRMRQVEAEFHPVAVLLQFSGNALTPCMEGYPYASQAYYDKYRADALAAIQIFGAAHIYLIGAPISKSQQTDPNWDMLNRQYAEIAAADAQHVTYVDAGTAVEGPDHSYVQTLPCLPVEPCTGPVVDGVPSNTVRAPDGVHFCPVISGDEKGVIGGCPIYSSGAYRYAEAMVTALNTPTAAGR